MDTRVSALLSYFLTRLILAEQPEHGGHGPKVSQGTSLILGAPASPLYLSAAPPGLCEQVRNISRHLWALQGCCTFWNTRSARGQK